jgi:hypothetical protein
MSLVKELINIGTFLPRVKDVRWETHEFQDVDTMSCLILTVYRKHFGRKNLLKSRKPLTGSVSKYI